MRGGAEERKTEDGRQRTGKSPRGPSSMVRGPEVHVHTSTLAMKSGICPKCQAALVFFQPRGPNQAERITISSGFVSKTAVPDRYVCTGCGYVEFYVADEEGLERIYETWVHVTPAE